MADEETFDKVKDFEDSDLPARQKAALGLADAYMTAPDRLDDALCRELRASFSERQLVELLLDLVNWTSHKISVAVASFRPSDGGLLMSSPEAMGKQDVATFFSAITLPGMERRRQGR